MHECAIASAITPLGRAIYGREAGALLFCHGIIRNRGVFTRNVAGCAQVTSHASRRHPARAAVSLLRFGTGLPPALHLSRWVVRMRPLWTHVSPRCAPVHVLVQELHAPKPIGGRSRKTLGSLNSDTAVMLNDFAGP